MISNLTNYINIPYLYCRKVLNIFLKLILKDTMAKIYRKNESTALRKLAASAISSVFEVILVKPNFVLFSTIVASYVLILMRFIILIF